MGSTFVPLPDNNFAKPYDKIINLIVDYAYDYEPTSIPAWTRAKGAFLDALGAAMEGLHTSQELRTLLEPPLPGVSSVPGGFRLPGTPYSLAILEAAFSMGAMIRYLDHNDAFPGAEWGHPSDNLGAILPVADILSRSARGGSPTHHAISMKQVIMAQIKAYEIQGVFQIRNAFNRVGLDHVILVKVASTAVVCWLMDVSRDQARAAVSHAWIDGHPLRTYRQAPNAGPRKGWAAGDACMRAVHLATLAAKGQPGVMDALTTKRWGFYDVLYGGKTFDLPRPFGTWVMENVLFKVDTAEGHALTAVEAALQVSKMLEERGLDAAGDIAGIRVRTQEAAMIIINKQGPLHNAADRDHCLRYMVAVVLLKKASIATADYQNNSPWASDARVDALRKLITMEEDSGFTKDYHTPEIRSLANAIKVTLKDGTKLPEVAVEFPLGHVRREETMALLRTKAIENLSLRFSPERVRRIIEAVDQPSFDDMPTDAFMDLFQL